MKHIESQIQRACVRWFRYQHPTLVLASFPNGGKRSPLEASILKAEGCLAGMPDLVLFVASGGYYGLFIEMKTLGGRLTENQINVQQSLKRAGYAVEVCRSLDQFKSIINNYL